MSAELAVAITWPQFNLASSLGRATTIAGICTPTQKTTTDDGSNSDARAKIPDDGLVVRAPKIEQLLESSHCVQELQDGNGKRVSSKKRLKDIGLECMSQEPRNMRSGLAQQCASVIRT